MKADELGLIDLYNVCVNVFAEKFEEYANVVDKFYLLDREFLLKAMARKYRSDNV